MNKIKMMVLGIAAWYSMAGVSSGNGVEQGRDWASYKGIFNIFDKFYQIPEANRNHLGFRIRAYSNSKRVILEEVVLTIKSHEGDREVRFGPGGTFILPRDKELVTENPRIWTSLPKSEKITLKPEAFISDLDGLEFKINDLLGWVKQADACVRAYSGIFSLFAPKVSAIEVVFSAVDGASVVVSSIKGTKVLPADSGGIVTIDTESEDYSSDTTFHLSTTPLELRPKIPDSIEFHSKTDS